MSQSEQDKVEWKPFKRGYLDLPTPEQLMEQFNDGEAKISLEEATREIERMKQQVIWMNNLYQVNVMELTPDGESGPALVHLSIKRLDKAACHDWRHFQRIKNEIVGPEYEAVELYPAESRLVDTANQYHLWVIKDETFRWPFGFGERLVVDNPGGNAVQRAREE